MKKIILFASGACLLLLSGCKTGESTLGGAAIGTAAGAGLGYAIGGDSGGAILGGVIGGLAGGAIGNSMAEDEAAPKPDYRYQRPHTETTSMQDGLKQDIEIERLKLERERIRLERERLENERKKLTQ